MAEERGIALAGPVPAFKKREFLGPMDVDRWRSEGYHRQGKRVLVDGVDITNGCRWFDDTIGEAHVYVKPYQIDRQTRNVKVTVLRGCIEVVDGKETGKYEADRVQATDDGVG